ncbi:DUF1295-domain-containing protein [Neoconidiobolus thromboides FSU 785]|nr:DUF1295-domain-containing protein [Neoconidiobolus thromboides FSU 785]
MRENFFKFLGFWVFQMIWVFIVSIPCTLINSPIYSKQEDFGNALDIIGIILFCIGLVIEAIADQQKFKFNNNRKDRLDIMNSGLWYYSRHPNYFGEIVCWWGIFLLSLGTLVYANDQSTIWAGILSPLLTMCLLLFLSGIPQSEPGKDRKMLEKGSSEQKQEYFKYLNSTSPVIPLPPTVYSNIPMFLKRIFFFEFPFYRFKEVQTPLI